MCIDIENIDRVAFLAPPFSITSMAQLLGRCGKKENTKKFRFYIKKNDIDDKATWQDRFRIQLFQSIAIVEITLKENIEPLETFNIRTGLYLLQKSNNRFISAS